MGMRGLGLGGSMIEYKNEEREDSGYLFICTCTLKGGVYDNQKMYFLSYMFHIGISIG